MGALSNVIITSSMLILVHSSKNFFRINRNLQNSELFVVLLLNKAIHCPSVVIANIQAAFSMCIDNWVSLSSGEPWVVNFCWFCIWWFINVNDDFGVVDPRKHSSCKHCLHINEFRILTEVWSASPASVRVFKFILHELPNSWSGMIFAKYFFNWSLKHLWVIGLLGGWI